MGSSLFDEFPDLLAAADRILGYSVRELCLEAPQEKLNQTQYTQPAMYIVNAMSYLDRLRLGGPAPDALIGHSLGEFNALLAAGVFDFETGLKLVQQRSLLMSEAVGGGMVAVMNVPPDDLQNILSNNGLDAIDLANFNAPDQIVISGKLDDIQRAEVVLSAHNKAFIRLNTSGAFHSRYMQSAKERFADVLSHVALAIPKITVISNCMAKPYGPDDVRTNLSIQITSPVRWAESVEYLMGIGAMKFEEIGEGGVLTNLVARIRAKGGGMGGKEAASSEFKKREYRSARLPTAEEKVKQWNARYGIGTTVRSKVIEGAVLKTKTEAVVLLGHRAAVYLEGYNGYFDLDEIVVVPDR